MSAALGGELLGSFFEHPFKEMSIEVVYDTVVSGENSETVERALGIKAGLRIVVSVLGRVVYHTTSAMIFAYGGQVPWEGNAAPLVVTNRSR